jgi:hypothetical protein
MSFPDFGARRIPKPTPTPIPMSNPDAVPCHDLAAIMSPILMRITTSPTFVSRSESVRELERLPFPENVE